MNPVVTCVKCHGAVFAVQYLHDAANADKYYLELSCRRCLTPMQFEVQLVESPVGA